MRFHRVIAAVMAFALLLGVGLAPVAAQDATPEAGSDLLSGLGYPELRLTTDGTSLDVPSGIEAGRYHMVLVNNSEQPVDLELYQLPEGITTDDLLAAFETGEIPDWFYELVSASGVSAPPGGTGEVVLDLTPGEWVFNLYTSTEESESNRPTIVNVTGEMPAFEEPPASVNATMIDFDFQLPDIIPAGPHIWKVFNEGSQPHHMILSRVPEGTTEEQVVELAGTFFGPPASPEAMASPDATALGPGDIEDVYGTLILSSAREMWTVIDLEPGTYAAICFIPTPDGTPHVMLGMVEIFTVEADAATPVA